MSDRQEQEWLKSTTNELNNLLQVMTESAQFLEKRYAGDSDSQKYFEILRNGIDRAVAVTRQMIERAGEESAARPEPSPFSPQGSIGSGQLPGLMGDSPRPAPSVRRPSAPAGADREMMKGVPISNPSGSKELILIVDDEDFVTLLAQRVLTDEGYRVVTARDGPQALDIYKKMGDEISLVILDFTMPMMDGSEVFDQLRMLNPRVAVVLSSGFTEQDKLRWMLAKGLRGFIPKHYTQQKLLLQVRSVLDVLKNERR